MTDNLADLAPTTLSRYQLTLVRRRDPRWAGLPPPADVARFLRREALAGHREDALLGALFVDARAAPMAYSLPYFGCLDRMMIDAKRLLGPGVVLGAAGLIVFHYLGAESDPWLSDRDVEVAELFRDAGELVAVRLLDYLVLGAGDAWVSLRRQGPLKLHALGEEVRRPVLKARLRPDDRRRQVKPKYADPERPQLTWSGRGRMARWLRERIAAGAELEDFRIEE